MGKQDKFYIMLMRLGGWEGVNLVSKHRRSSPHCSSGQRRQKRCHQICSTYFPILFIPFHCFLVTLLLNQIICVSKGKESLYEVATVQMF